MKQDLLLKKIEHDLPKRFYENAEERLTDSETGHTIAVMKAAIYGKERDIMVAYKHEDVAIKLVAIHPLVVEISPGVTMELDSNGKLIGVELFKASHMFKNVLKPMEKKLQVA